MINKLQKYKIINCKYNKWIKKLNNLTMKKIFKKLNNRYKLII